MNAITKTLYALLLAALASAVGGSAWAQAVTVITIADKPLRIIRGAAIYKAAGGTVIQKEDIVETAAGSAQLEAGPDAIIAMGPNTRLYIAGLASDGRATDVQLLQGWVKLASKGGAKPGVTTAGLQTSFASGAVIVFSKPGKEALFADEGEQLVTRIDDKGKSGTPVKLPSEQFAFALAAQPLVVQVRPTKDFLAEMPPQFRDRLVPTPASVRAPKAAAVKERDADLADVAPWLSAALPARKGFVGRFRPRLKDPQFRKQLEQALPGPEWKAVLSPSSTAIRVPVAPANPARPDNHIF